MMKYTRPDAEFIELGNVDILTTSAEFGINLPFQDIESKAPADKKLLTDSGLPGTEE